MFEHGPKHVSPLAVPLMMGNAAAAAVSMRHGLRGPRFGTCRPARRAPTRSARRCARSRCGDADAVVTGGAEAALTPLSQAAFAALDALSACGVSRPFDARRDGFVMGEGAGVLVLEDGEAARARGARILACCAATARRADAHHVTAPDAGRRGRRGGDRARARRRRRRRRSDVVYVNAHGTSTPLNDRAETIALKAALGEHAARIPISSTKSAIGHLLGAAGAVEAVATILALRARLIPPTLGLEQPDPDLDLDYVPDSRAPARAARRPARRSRSPTRSASAATTPCSCLEGAPAPVGAPA